MFLKRLGMVFLIIGGVILLGGCMIGLTILVDKYREVDKFGTWMQNNGQYVLVSIVAPILFYMLFQFIKWLFIEPFLAWRKKKRGKKV